MYRLLIRHPGGFDEWIRISWQPFNIYPLKALAENDIAELSALGYEHCWEDLSAQDHPH